MPLMPIIDLHCDLLSYLELNSKRTPYDASARCSLLQLKQGQVKLQLFAIFTITGVDSVKRGQKQASIYQQMLVSCFKDIAPYSFQWDANAAHLFSLIAFENSSGFCDEKEPLENGLSRLRTIIHQIAKPLYISLTWNTENRFGGGALTRIGLKPDGKRLLDELHQQQIAIDLSHASDALAYEVIDYIEGKNLQIAVIASHSNSRAILEVPRNLPDDIAKEIFRRKGLIGLNLYRSFVGENEEDILKHIIHWLELGGENYLSLGADFFYELDLPTANQKNPYFNSYENGSCYSKLIDFLYKELQLPALFFDKLAYRNALNFINFLS